MNHQEIEVKFYVNDLKRLEALLLELGAVLIQPRVHESNIRFALPDGEYQLPVIATSASGADARAANLQFTRATQYGGEVGAHPQDPALKPPNPEHV